MCIGEARRGRYLRPAPRDDDDGWSQVEGGGDGEDVEAVGVAHGGLPPERRQIHVVAGHPGLPCVRRALAPRAAHHQVPTGDFPSKGRSCLL
ncbi:Ankyrin repeat family protein, partial [Zea mays]